MANLYDRDKHWTNVPDEKRSQVISEDGERIPSMLVYLANVLYNYIDANKKPPDYYETKQMLVQAGYSTKLIAEQKKIITDMLLQTHNVYEKGLGKGALKFPVIVPKQRVAETAVGGKRKRRKTKKKRKTLKKRNRRKGKTRRGGTDGEKR
jgi:hypothetical protein